VRVLPHFAYVRPTTLREAVRHLADPEARAHAGGTDLLGSLRDGVVRAHTLVSLSGVRELTGITARDDGGLRIGALTTLSELAVHPHVLAGYAALAQAATSATISPGCSTFSRVMSSSGRTKNDSKGTMRSPAGPTRRARASSATSGAAVSDGWTMTQADPPNSAWCSFAPEAA